MRRVVVSLFVLAACARPAPRELVPVPARDAPVPGCRGEGNELRIGASVTDAPLVVLSEVMLHGDPLFVPTIAIWADGHVVFAPDGHDVLFEAQLPPARATAIAAEVFAMLAGQRPFTEAGLSYVDGGQITTITARQGERWRSSALYGVFREDFLGLPRTTPPPAPSGPTPDGFVLPYGPSLADGLVPPPPQLAAAYRTLLASRPARGDRFVAHDHELIFWRRMPDTTYGPEVAWPRDLPAPPRELDPRRCDPLDSDGCAYAIGPAYRVRVRDLRQTISRGRRPVIVHGHSFWLEIRSRYRGEPTIEAVDACQRSLERKPPSSRSRSHGPAT